MKKFELTFNPYTKESRLVVGGKPDKKRKEAICGQDGTDLALWATDFFPRAVASFNDAVDVTFNGIERDYEFLEDALKAFPEKGSQIKPGTISKPEDRLQKLRALFAKMQKESPFAVLKSEKQKRDFEIATNSEYEMAVVATMSSGKSTLINSMLGREILPAKNEPTTARTASIHNIRDALGFTAMAYDSKGNVIEKVDPLTFEQMDRLNNDRNILAVHIFGAIPGIESKEISLVLTDTPGPNSSQCPEHQERTYKLLNADWKPMILYVINATQFGINDDKALLNKIRELVHVGDRQSHDRFLFVLNKADEFNSGRGESAAKMLDKARKYLEDHGIINPRIMPVSALLAKLIRQNQNHESLSDDEEDFLFPKIRRFIQDPLKHFTDYAHFLSPATGTALKARVEKAKAENNEMELALLYSGVPSVEMAISEYLTKYAIPDKIAQGVETFKARIDSLKIEADAKKSIEHDKKRIAKLQKALKRLQAVLKKGDMAKKVKLQIESLTVEKETKQLLVKGRQKLMEAFGNATNGLGGKMAIEDAKAKVEQLAATIASIQADFVAQTEKAINHILIGHADKCIDQYNAYIRDIMGEARFTMPVDIILPHDFHSSGEKDLDDYVFDKKIQIRTETYKVENRQRSTIWNGTSLRAMWARVIGRDSFLGRSAYIECKRPVYGRRKFLDFGKYLSESLLPEIEYFATSTRKTAIEDANKAADAFKAEFLTQIKGLNKTIQKKAAELQQTLADEKKLKVELEKNQKNLEWLKEFLEDLDKILTI